jgi:hypothetical protein
LVHDKFRWHCEGRFPADVDKHQAYVPAGFLIAWLAEERLLSAEAEREFWTQLERLRARAATGAETYRLLGGVLASDLLQPKADAFLRDYLNPDSGGYWADYHELSIGLPSEYHVPDSWASYDRISAFIDRSFSRWCDRTS